jgi:hypothetical protein
MRPRHLVSGRGRQFIAKGFRRWCRRWGIQLRFGALDKHGSLAVIGRSMRTLKRECTRRLILIPYRLARFEQELAPYFTWHNGHRPHSWLRGATPDEIYHRRRPAIRAPRFEPRSRWPRRSPCASPRTLIRGQSGVKLDLSVQFPPSGDTSRSSRSSASRRSSRRASILRQPRYLSVCF